MSVNGNTIYYYDAWKTYNDENWDKIFPFDDYKEYSYLEYLTSLGYNIIYPEDINDEYEALFEN